MIPPGGWHFPIAPGITIQADSYEQLQQLVHDNRLRMGKPEGNIQYDINQYFCRRWPHACLPEAEDIGYAVPAPAVPETPSRAVARFASTLVRNMPNGGYELVTQSQANDRSHTCAFCPRQQEWKTGCSACSQATARSLLELRRLRNSPDDALLKACQFTGGENQTQVHLPLTALQLTPAILDALPANCWIKKESREG